MKKLLALLLFCSLPCLADITLYLTSSSCTQGIGQASLHGSWADGIGAQCFINNGLYVFSNNAQCVNQYPASARWTVNVTNGYCVYTGTLNNPRYVANGCGQATSPPYAIVYRCCYNGN